MSHSFSLVNIKWIKILYSPGGCTIVLMAKGVSLLTARWSPSKVSAVLPKLHGRHDSSGGPNLLPLPSLPPRNREQKSAFLEIEMKDSQRAAFRNGMCSNYLNYLNQYEQFCDEYGYSPFPMKEIVLSMFAQYLSRKLKPQSIKAVLSGLQTVWTTAGFQIPQKTISTHEHHFERPRGIWNQHPQSKLTQWQSSCCFKSGNCWI